ncbi:hypothetical protein KIMH_06710 [Bombiscardovia apis]|uniref:Uncharacterized protein n=1 Tax=Bombiscardovia apis TaxID=2932182 RepID=A0ABM8BCF3_9BIFI|nr:hypothetical protein KIMH_06460 [Bombiscardovia apis]BDR54560.1 hypothetical protein KIMH_06710 [Bombiscardovia apis]
MAIAGIDDIPSCQLVTPQFSSVHVEHREMRMLAADRLIDTEVPPNLIFSADNRKGSSPLMYPEIRREGFDAIA